MFVERKTYTAAEVKAAGDKRLVVEAIVATETPDRAGDIMRVDGMRINGKPVVLFQHGHGPMGTEPVGRVLAVEKTKLAGRTPALAARVEFYPDDTGRRLYDKVVGGYMPNWSIGFRPLKETGRGLRAGRLIEEWELLEISPVAVPMNPEAQTITKGLRALDEWAARMKRRARRAYSLQELAPSWFSPSKYWRN